MSQSITELLIFSIEESIFSFASPFIEIKSATLFLIALSSIASLPLLDISNTSQFLNKLFFTEPTAKKPSAPPMSIKVGKLFFSCI